MEPYKRVGEMRNKINNLYYASEPARDRFMPEVRMPMMKVPMMKVFYDGNELQI
jgi:hypothetical protein